MQGTPPCLHPRLGNARCYVLLLGPESKGQRTVVPPSTLGTWYDMPFVPYVQAAGRMVLLCSKVVHPR